MAERTIKLTIRIPEKIDSRLKLKASSEMISKNALIIRACRKLIEQQASNVRLE